jgi:hypothetical protein
LNPIIGEQVRKTNDGIPENIPENAMAPALNKAHLGKNGVIFVFIFINHINEVIF